MAHRGIMEKKLETTIWGLGSRDLAWFTALTACHGQNVSCMGPLPST